MVSPSNELFDRLLARLQQPLPGRSAQRQFAPSLSYGRHFAPTPSGARQAAVVAMLVERNSRWYIPITRRTMDLADHAGQICLPGGMLRQHESTWTGAQRELHEEIGIDVRNVKCIGKLTPLYLYNSNFHVTPFLALHVGNPQYTTCPTEVAELIHLPLEKLVTASPVTRKLGAMDFTSPCIVHDEHHVWGATAMILGEVRELLAAEGKNIL